MERERKGTQMLRGGQMPAMAASVKSLQPPFQRCSWKKERGCPVCPGPRTPLRLNASSHFRNKITSFFLCSRRTRSHRTWIFPGSLCWPADPLFLFELPLSPPFACGFGVQHTHHTPKAVGPETDFFSP